MTFMVRRKRGARNHLQDLVGVKLGHFGPMCSTPDTHTRTPAAPPPPCTVRPLHGIQRARHPSARFPHACPHLPSASKRRQAPRKAAASRRPSAPLSMVLPPALTLSRRRSLCPGPAARPGFQGGGPAPGAAPRGQGGNSPPSRGSYRRPPPAPSFSGAVGRGAVAGRS